MMTWRPGRRPSAREMLSHEWVRGGPLRIASPRGGAAPCELARCDPAGGYGGGGGGGGLPDGLREPEVGSTGA
jgi:hypothetical protein